MKIQTIDYTNLINLRDAIFKYDKIDVSELTKKKFSQDFIDNSFIQDFNSDKIITQEEHEIIWGWLAQGKPNDVATLIKNASVQQKKQKKTQLLDLSEILCKKQKMM